ncbi:MAG: carboxypeptidase-like regulatory domain-containing protein [Cyclobacteriaceae bacterium]
MKLFSVLFLSLPLLCFSQFRIVGKLVSKSTGEPIQYATILNIENSQNGTTSNEQGEFKLLMPSGSGNHRILISVVAYQDTILTVCQLTQTTFPLKLNESIQKLDEVTYVPGDVQYDIGKPFGQVNDTSGAFTFSLSSLTGVYIHKKKNQKGIINSISICIANQGHPTAPFFVRMLKLEDIKAKNMKMDSIAKMSDLFPEPIVVQANGPGWIEIDLSSYNVTLPEKDFYVIVNPIDHGEKYKWGGQNDNYEKYGITIASYENIDKDIQYSMSYKERIARIKEPARYKDYRSSPAIAISYLAPKE